MSKIDYQKEFPVTHSAVIKMLRAKFRALSPLPNHFISSATPKFSEKTPEVPSITKRITLMYRKREKRAKSAASSSNKMESPRVSISKSPYFNPFHGESRYFKRGRKAHTANSQPDCSDSTRSRFLWGKSMIMSWITTLKAWLSVFFFG